MGLYISSAHRMPLIYNFQRSCKAFTVICMNAGYMPTLNLEYYLKINTFFSFIRLYIAIIMMHQILPSRFYLPVTLSRFTLLYFQEVRVKSMLPSTKAAVKCVFVFPNRCGGVFEGQIRGM